MSPPLRLYAKSMSNLFPSGFLILNKPAGITSRAALNHVQKSLPRKIKLDHAGTLDPLAKGVLIIAVGYATRLVEYVHRLPKQYAAKFLLGKRSPTEDVDGEVEDLDSPPIPALEDIQAAIRGKFSGRIQQVPPAYSALKINGKRAYDLARAGEEVELAAREVEIYRCDVLAYKYPELQILMECSGGTYVRSLGRDLAESLGTSAVMSGLTRTAIGAFHVGLSVELDAISEENWRSHLLPAAEGVADLPRIELSEDEFETLARGNAQIEATLPKSKTDEVAALDKHGRLIAILSRRAPGVLGPVRNFAPLFLQTDPEESRLV